MSWEMQLDDQLLGDLYEWIDNLPLTRPKKRIERDFSDGKLVAEIIGYYFPELVDLHNYSSANSLDHKKSNWEMLNKKVLSQFGLDLSNVIITGLSNGKPGLIEVLLYNVRLKVDEQLELQSKHSSRHTSRSSSTSTSMKNSTYRLNQSSNFNEKISRFNYEEIKQEYLQQEEQIETLQAKLHRLEHLLQLKDTRIDQLLNTLQNDQNIKSHRSNK